MQIFAHSLENQPVSCWQTLSAHAEGVSRLASQFASDFQSEALAGYIGYWHDLGKARESFQAYLLKQNGLETGDLDEGEKNHANAGAAYALKSPGGNSPFGLAAAYCIAGHHAGIPDWVGGETPNGALIVQKAEGENVLSEPAVQRYAASVSSQLQLPKLTPPWPFSKEDVALWIRMLYSCLTDADFLDTEGFVDAERTNARGGYPPIEKLARRFFAALDAKQQGAPLTEVNKIRSRVRLEAEHAAEEPTGLFSMTVPTGGGKTLSSTAFALRHALKHGLKRIIYVIPYTSIVEQTADVLRAFFGDDAVVEHHCNLDPERETLQSRLASENWDAPIIVTTSVQFFESLFSCSSSRCRKLHNIIKSVVILDEVQLLPPNLLWPCTWALQQLTNHYHTSVLLSTATQPALGMAGPLQDVTCRRIISDEAALFAQLKRVAIELPKDLSARMTWKEIAALVATERQVLVIVNSKKECRELAEFLPQEGLVYLSTNLCGAHRSVRIAEIRRRLGAGEVVRVVSTQLIEAGVDVDFPVVYRAFTGYSSIVQAAGRCNREGKQAALGRVVVFMPPKPSPIGLLRKAEDAMTEMFAVGPVSFDNPDASVRYFEQFYSRQNDDGRETFKRLLVNGASRFQLQFREAATAFKMIEDATVPVFVRYGEGEELIARYRAIGRPVRDLMRKMQRYAVSVYRTHVPDLLEKGFIEELPPAGSGLYVQTMPSVYDGVYGFQGEKVSLEAEDLIV